MNRIIYYSLIALIFIAGISVSILQAQMKDLHGTDAEFRTGIHAGNLFRVSFFNDGTYGAVGNAYEPGVYIGEWPINGGLNYLVDGNIFVVAEVKDVNGNTIHISSENKSANIGGSSGDKRPDGSWRTFLPLAGFANPNNSKIAMARGSVEKANSWPPFWPDIADTANPYKIYSADGWAGSWNGYFGRNVFNADEESYFVADDYQNDEFAFYPDSTDLSRRGLGIRIYVRGFQWSKAAVEDGIFCLYDIHNIGTTKYDKVVFGYKIGNNMGELNSSAQDLNDDYASFNKDLDLAYMWDGDDIGGQGRTPVGEMGGAFLESPGNSYDGIDNDNDGSSTSGPSTVYTIHGPISPKWGSGPNLSVSMFDRGVLNLDDPQIVIIDYNNPQFKRSAPTTLRAALAAVGKGSTDTLTITYGARSFQFWAGKPIVEIGDDLFDNNLNGLIDENRGFQDNLGISHYLYMDTSGVGYKCIDYFSADSNTNGMKNTLIDEARNDGIDNNGNWNPINDDVGADGVGPNDRIYKGADIGEGDGVPSPGEPHFDKTDIDETDMMGLTSFLLYAWSGTAGSQQADDEWLWTNLYPGFFSAAMNGNIELLYGSGYFPLIPGQLERLSMAIICGWDHGDLVRNKGYFAEAYEQNYNFAKAPYIPTARAIAGDNRVTLVWDSLAEYSDDPISGMDFEGYKIYRSTDAGWNDCNPITDAYGSVVFREPIAQFDLDDNYSGLAAVATQGVHFNLGNNTGLRHYWVDTTARNGYTYYYAVTSYDHGDPVRGIDPAECTKYISLSSNGTVDEKGNNVVVVRPEAPSAGYVPPDFKNSKISVAAGSTADGTVDYEIVDRTLIKNNHTYRITFNDTTTGTGANLVRSTLGYNLIDTTSHDTIIVNSPLPSTSDEQIDLVKKTGFRLLFTGYPTSIQVDSTHSGWSRTGIQNYAFAPISSNTGLGDYTSIQLPCGDYKIEFSDVGVDTSKYYRKAAGATGVYPAIPVNFKITNTRTMEKVNFAFWERDTVYGDSTMGVNGSRKGIFSFSRRATSDIIIFLSKVDSPWVAGWTVRFDISSVITDSLAKERQLRSGDTLMITLNCPFLSHDTLWFTTLAPSVNTELTKTDLEKIRVVPNPYVVANSWEPHNPYTNGRGERQLHFIHLPAKCTIRIFNIRGQLINTLENDAAINDGTYIWNMLSKDNLEISYGIYIYHVQAEGIGEKIGKFVVLK